MKATEEQIRELANHIANKAEALAEGKLVGPRYAAVRGLKEAVATLEQWIGDDR